MKEYWQRLRSRLPVRADPDLRKLISFFLTVLLLTLFARGSAGASMAKVTVGTPESRTMSRELFSPGTLTPLGNEAHPIPDGLVIDDILVETGAEIAQGDSLATVETDALDELLTRKNAELRQMELQLETLLDNEEPSHDGVQNAKDALSDAKDAKKSSQAALADAEDALALAREALSSAPEEERPAAEAALQEAEAAVLEAEQLLSAAEAQVTSAKDTLEREEEAYADAMTQARRSRESNEASASVLELDIAALAAEVASLEAVREAGYCITAPDSGILAALPLTEGAQTGGAELLLTTLSGGHLLTFQTTQEDAPLVTADLKLTVTREDQTTSVYACTPEESTLHLDQVTFTAPFYKPDWDSGSVTVSAVLWQQCYDACVPLSALHQDAEGYFVYVLVNVSDLWGVEQQARRVDVQIERLDGAWAAVQGGLDPDMAVILTSSKPISDGSRVRVTP